MTETRYYVIKGTDIVLVKDGSSYKDLKLGCGVYLPDEYLKPLLFPKHMTIWIDETTGKELVYNDNTRMFTDGTYSIPLSQFFVDRPRFTARKTPDSFAEQLRDILVDYPGEPVTLVYDEGEFTASMFDSLDGEIRHTRRDMDEALEEVATDLNGIDVQKLLGRG